MSILAFNDSRSISVIRAFTASIVGEVQTKKNLQSISRYKEVCRGVHCRQFEKCETELCKSLFTVFEEQIESAAARLTEIGSGMEKGIKFSQSAEQLASQIFNPVEWDQKIVNAALPPLALAMAEAMISQIKLMEQRNNKIYSLSNKMKKVVNWVGSKVTTATEWLEGVSDDVFEDVIFITPLGQVSMSIVTEFPSWMKDTMQIQLRETFAQPYWSSVSVTTLNDITEFVDKGIINGWSIPRMAREIARILPDEGRYARVRATNIARTESGHILNGARSAVIDDLAADIGEELPIKKIWLSVLGTTTRATHANLDGVPENKQGLWELAGILVRWPSDISLPPGERCFCLCTVIAGFGMTDTEANELIGDYDLRK